MPLSAQDFDEYNEIQVILQTLELNTSTPNQRIFCWGNQISRWINIINSSLGGSQIIKHLKPYGNLNACLNSRFSPGF
jgi:hypothetical protein